MTWEGRWAGDGVIRVRERREVEWGWCDKIQGGEGGGVRIV